MHLKSVTYASLIAIGVGASALSVGATAANAAPPCPPQFGCQGGPGGGGPGGGPPPQRDQGGPPPGGQGGPPPGDHGGQGGPGDHGGPPWGQGGPPPGGGPPDWRGPHNDGPGGPPDWRGPDYRGGPGGPQWGPPPPNLAWRGIGDGRRDHQPFNYNNNWVEPIYSPIFNNWGFWFLGIWIPL